LAVLIFSPFLWCSFHQRACSLVGAGAGLGWLVLVFCERKTLLAGWFGLVETSQHEQAG